MNQKPLTFLITHGDLAEILLQTVEKILGPQENVAALSNQSDSLPVLIQKIKDIIAANKNLPAIFFTDLKGGSCWTLTQMLKKEFPNLIAISGVNVPMLISYFSHQDHMTFSELITKTIEDGRRGISEV